jgi:Calcineurin-like phosphoesterase superfamily domain
MPVVREGQTAALMRSEANAGGRVVIMSDIHGNARAYEAGLMLARKRGFDQLIILGDLLTYGCEPAMVLELTCDAIAQHGALLVKGNHDQLYFDLARGDRAYYDSLPSWLIEAVDWTADTIGDCDLEGMFPWVARYEFGNILFAHANPFDYGDWTYLNGPVEVAGAARVLGGRRHLAGVFGHTHRHKVVEVDAGGRLHVAKPIADGTGVVALRRDTGECRTTIVDPGSVGQPRDSCKLSTMLFLSYSPGILELEFVRIPYDVEAHKKAIMDALVSGATKSELLGYFP